MFQFHSPHLACHALLATHWIGCNIAHFVVLSVAAQFHCGQRSQNLRKFCSTLCTKSLISHPDNLSPPIFLLTHSLPLTKLSTSPQPSSQQQSLKFYFFIKTKSSYCIPRACGKRYALSTKLTKWNDSKPTFYDCSPSLRTKADSPFPPISTAST